MEVMVEVSLGILVMFLFFVLIVVVIDKLIRKGCFMSFFGLREILIGIC